MIQLIHMIPGQGGGRRAIIQVLGVEAGNQYQYVRSSKMNPLIKRIPTKKTHKPALSAT